MNRIFADLPVTIFESMSQAARENDAVNLGQGFPDDPGPLDLREKAADAVINGHNQYPSMMGTPELRQAIATHYAHWHDVALDPMTEVMVTSGATEALGGALFGLIQPGDEVIVFQPMYDSYVPIIRRAGGVPKFVRLEPPHWLLPEENDPPRDYAENEIRAFQQSAQSGSHRLSSRESRNARACVSRIRPDRDLR